jgi:acetyl esterase/lipase
VKNSGLYQPHRTFSLYSPFLFKSHADLPLAYFQMCGVDTFWDGAFIYEKLPRDAGSQTKVDHYPGVPHAF